MLPLTEIRFTLDAISEGSETTAVKVTVVDMFAGMELGVATGVPIVGTKDGVDAPNDGRGIEPMIGDVGRVGWRRNPHEATAAISRSDIIALKNSRVDFIFVFCLVLEARTRGEKLRTDRGCLVLALSGSSLRRPA